MRNMTFEAVIPTDIQADFTELRSGALAVPKTGQDYVDLVISATGKYRELGHPIVCTQDYHPADHISFHTRHPDAKAFDVISPGGREQILWPPHCVEETAGAEILIPPAVIDRVVRKGTRREFDSYSAFRDDGGLETGMKEVLGALGAERLIVFGLATDFCVLNTVLHAREEGFEVVVHLDLCRGITPEGIRSAIEKMKAAGAEVR